MYDFKNKNILITAGPTWVPIDTVRVISNTATGETGVLLARKLAKLGAKITLLLGPINPPIPPFGKGGIKGGFKTIRIIRFKFFDELKAAVIHELKSKKYDVVIHSAAVSDYKPANPASSKISSNIKTRNLKLVTTEKIIDLFKKINPALFAVGFKFQPHAKKEKLTEEAKKLILRANLDLVVANTVKNNKYQAWVIGKDKIYSSSLNKKTLIKQLINKL